MSHEELETIQVEAEVEVEPEVEVDTEIDELDKVIAEHQAEEEAETDEERALRFATILQEKASEVAKIYEELAEEDRALPIMFGQYVARLILNTTDLRQQVTQAVVDSLVFDNLRRSSYHSRNVIPVPDISQANFCFRITLIKDDEKFAVEETYMGTRFQAFPIENGVISETAMPIARATYAFFIMAKTALGATPEELLGEHYALVVVNETDPTQVQENLIEKALKPQ